MTIAPEEEARLFEEATKEQALSEERIVEPSPEEVIDFEAARSEPEYETKDGKYILTKTPEGIDIFNIQNQRSVKPGSAQAKAALEEYKESVIERLKRSKQA